MFFGHSFSTTDLLYLTRFQKHFRYERHFRYKRFVGSAWTKNQRRIGYATHWTRDFAAMLNQRQRR